MLLAAVKANLPFRLLGVTLRQNDQNLVHAVEALGGTPLPPVRKALEDIANRFPGQDAGKAAARVLAGFEKLPAAPRTVVAAPEAAGQPAGRPRGVRSSGSAPEPLRLGLQRRPHVARRQERRHLRRC